MFHPKKNIKQGWFDPQPFKQKGPDPVFRQVGKYLGPLGGRTRPGQQWGGQGPQISPGALPGPRWVDEMRLAGWVSRLNPPQKKDAEQLMS